MASPNERINEMYRQRREHSDAQILAELASLAPLPHDDDPWWLSGSDDCAPDAALLYVALLDVAADRGLVESIPLFLARASDGDFGEMMRALPKALWAIANGDDARLREYCVAALESERAGTRFWATETLDLIK